MSHTPTHRVHPVFLAALVAAIGACGDSATEPAGMTISDLVGSWKASSVVFTSQANSSQQFDIVAAGGELRVTVLDHGGARTWLTIGPVDDEWDAQLTLNGNQLTSTPVEASRPTRHYTAELSGTRLTLTSTDAIFDFTLSGGSGVPAREVIVLQKQ